MKQQVAHTETPRKKKKKREKEQEMKNRDSLNAKGPCAHGDVYTHTLTLIQVRFRVEARRKKRAFRTTRRRGWWEKGEGKAGHNEHVEELGTANEGSSQRQGRGEQVNLFEA